MNFNNYFRKPFIEAKIKLFLTISWIMIGSYVADNPEQTKEMQVSLLILEVLLFFLGIFILLDLVDGFRKDIGISLILSSISLLVVFFVGKSLHTYRTDLLRRSILNYYRDSILEKPDNIDEEIQTKKYQLTKVYVNEHVLLSILAVLSSFLIGMSNYLMDLLGYPSFAVLELAGFLVLGMVGYLIIILAFYRNYSYDPEALLNQNVNNFRRVSATGRKDPGDMYFRILFVAIMIIQFSFFMI